MRCIRFMRRLLLPLLAATTLHAVKPDAPLPEGVSVENGARFVDLNGDGFDDLVFSNSERYGVFIFNDVEKKNLGWFRGWTHVMREGRAGDAHALPLTTRDDVAFKDGAMWAAGKKFLSYAELLRPPAPAPRTPEESMKAIHLKPGFQIELVAAEPDVRQPVCLNFDERGRAFAMNAPVLFTTTGALHFGWVIPAAILVLVLFLAFLGFLRRLHHLSPRTARRFVLAGALYVTGAVACDIPLGWWTSVHGDDNFVYYLID